MVSDELLKIVSSTFHKKKNTNSLSNVKHDVDAIQERIKEFRAVWRPRWNMQCGNVANFHDSTKMSPTFDQLTSTMC